LVAVAAGVAGRWRGADNGGYRLVAGFGLGYAGLAVWHFVAHVNQSDPAVAHVLIAVSKVGIVGAAVVAALKAREASARGRSP
jgi:Mrp family chromosome partitioning ATPase